MAEKIFGRRILIFAAHPDDEVVACAAAIGRAKRQGAQIFVCYLTDGCLARQTLWPWLRNRHAAYVARRRKEAEGAARRLAIDPVGWSTRATRFLWREISAVHHEMQAAIAACRPDQLWVPAYEGGNPDHDALNALGALFAPQMSVLEFAEYNFFGARVCSQRFPFPRGDECEIVFDPKEREQKRELLDHYASERGNLNYVETVRESCRPLADYDYARPPHPGVVWYARFQWVPFRHPRVDFTRPEEVSQAISAYHAQYRGQKNPAD